MMDAFIGTSGYSYPEWKGSFYPEKTKSAAMLAYYATQLRSVEINNTFYRMPRSAAIEGWTSQVTPEFRFAVKATRRITHFKKLKDPDELLAFLFKGFSHFGQSLGPVLFQLPPTMKADVGLLSEFLHRLPEELRVAFEFRHASWFCDQVYAALEQRGAALVGGDLDEDQKSPPLVKTGRFLYLRLRKTEYAEGALEAWAKDILERRVDEVYGYFKHEVLGPQLARQLSELLAE